ncbi:hypothetical protein L218DRAFT_313461, partial [Marasmius fiardii PR-910]
MPIQLTFPPLPSHTLQLLMLIDTIFPALRDFLADPTFSLLRSELCLALERHCDNLVACADFSSLDVQYQKLNWGVPLSIQLLLESFTEGPNALRVFSPRPPKWFLPRERVERLRKSGVFLLDLKSSGLSVAQRWFQKYHLPTREDPVHGTVLYYDLILSSRPSTSAAASSGTTLSVVTPPLTSKSKGAATSAAPTMGGNSTPSAPKAVAGSIARPVPRRIPPPKEAAPISSSSTRRPSTRQSAVEAAAKLEGASSNKKGKSRAVSPPPSPVQPSRYSIKSSKRKRSNVKSSKSRKRQKKHSSSEESEVDEIESASEVPPGEPVADTEVVEASTSRVGTSYLSYAL